MLISSEQLRRGRQYFAAFSISIGAWGYGTVLGWPSNITDDLREGLLNNITMTNKELSWTGSSPTLGAMISCLIIGFIADALGRKFACFLTLIPSLAGWICIIWALNAPMVYAGRFLTGFGGGGFVVIAPVYTTEISETKIRGTCGLILQILLIWGVFYANFCGWYFTMLWYNISCFIVPVVFGILFSFQPESPFWYVAQNRREEAEKALKRLRGKDYDITDEMQLIYTLIEHRPERNFKTFVTSIKKRAQIKATVICFSFMFFQKYSGVNVMVFYTKDVFISAGTDIPDHVGVMIAGFIGFLGTVVTCWVIDISGRVILLTLSTFFCALSTFFIGLYFHLKETWEPEDLRSMQFLPLMGMFMFLFSFNLGIGSIPWLSCSELWEPTIKAKLGSVACAFNWSQAFVVSRFYLGVSADIGIHNTFYIFTLISLSGVAFVILLVPETKNKTYAEILPGLEKICIHC